MSEEYTARTNVSQRRERLQEMKERFIEQFLIFKRSKMAMAGLVIVLFFVLMALTAPFLTPYDQGERVYSDDGSWHSDQPPSVDHPLGTTEQGFDVLSQLWWGSQIAVFVGFLGAFMVVVIGTTIGTVAGYYGGIVDELITRFMDILYGLPFIPFVIVIATIWGANIWNVIFGIAFIYWLTSARVIRSEVLSIKERQYVQAARAAGASDLRIMGVHIIPNILPLTALYGAIAVGYSIAAEASISFLGFGDTEVPSWGIMLQRAYFSQSLDMWWWFFPPGLAISVFVLGAFLIGYGYDEIVNPQLREG